MRILVIDVGGSHVKLLATDADEARRFDSGPDFTPTQLVERTRELSTDWNYDAISLGYPGAMGPNGPSAEPGNLGPGWVGFDYEAAFGKPIRIVNDAVMQALGGYDGGRMLFLGLGTGLGSSLVTERVIVPLELGSLAWTNGETLFDLLGRDGLERRGRNAWMQTLRDATHTLRDAFMADYIVLGGGNVEQVEPMPSGTRRGGNDDAFTGGFRLWEDIVQPHDHPPTPIWRVVR